MEQKKQEKHYMLTEEEKAAILKNRAEREKKMATDPEFRAKMEERDRQMNKILPLIRKYRE